MATKPNRKMTMAERAKQFMPFSALKGLDEALAKKEQEFVLRREVSDEEERAINEVLSKLKVHDKVFITYYDAGKNRDVCGEIKKLDKALLLLEIDKTTILFNDILSIKEI